MCTVTVQKADGRLVVTMNRDERRERGPEEPPALRVAPDGAEWAGPLDAPSGGTWIGVNRAGVVACLLNAYRPMDDRPPPSRGPKASRGEIVPQLLAQGSAADAARWVEESLQPRQYPSFTLVVADGRGAGAWLWNGAGAIAREPWPDRTHMVTSSSWRTAEVLAWRLGAFSAWRQAGEPDAGLLPAWHLLQPEGLAEWAPLMARPTTCTRSITQVELAQPGAAARIRYWHMPEPGSAPPDAEFELPLD